MYLELLVYQRQKQLHSIKEIMLENTTPEISYQLDTIGDIARKQALLGCCYIEMKISQLASRNYFFCRKYLFSIDPHCQF